MEKNKGGRIVNWDRIQRVIANMRQEGLEQILVSSTASLYYLTGLWVETGERMLVLYLHESGEVRLFGNEIFGIVPPEGLVLHTHKDAENPVEELAGHVRPGKLGIDKFWSSKFLIGLMELCPQMKPVLGSDPVDNARMRKDAQEAEAMRKASIWNDEVMKAVIGQIKEGITEKELTGEINRQYELRGADKANCRLVCFGKNGADPHHGADHTVIKPGDSVIMDIFTPFDRYWCDMTRTVFYREVSQRQRQVYELVKQANEAAIARVKPGVLLSELDRTAREVIAQGGYGPYFTHRLGHGIGLECHEPPDVSSASQKPLEAGMVFSIEPGIYLPGEFGVRIEDLVLVTEDGCEVLNGAPKELLVVE